MRLLIGALPAALVTLSMAGGEEAHAAAIEGCRDLTPSGEAARPADRRLPTAMDLVRLRDVGWPASVALDGVSAIAVSPDGARVAFQIRRADPRANQYCLGLYVATIGARPQLIEVDAGGELIRETLTRTGIANFPTGVPKVITPHWSPDGEWIAYLKRRNGITQVWRARADGSAAEAVMLRGDEGETAASIKMRLRLGLSA